MNYTSLTLGELLSSDNPAIKRNAVGILKQLQKDKPQTDLYQNGKDNLKKEAKKWLKDMDEVLSRSKQSLDQDTETFEGSAYQIICRFLNLYCL